MTTTTDEAPTYEAPRKMLSIEEVLKLVPISRTTLFRLEREGRFPEGRVVGGRGKAWFADDIARWQQHLSKTRVRRVQAGAGRFPIKNSA